MKRKEILWSIRCEWGVGNEEWGMRNGELGMMN